MKCTCKITKRANGKCDLEITFTTQQMLANYTMIQAKITDRIDL